MDVRTCESGGRSRSGGGADLIALNTLGWNRLRYSLYAPVYDWIVRLDRARAEAIEALELRAGERVLIPGAGTGQDLDLLPRGLDVVAGDIAPGMVRRLRRRATAWLDQDADFDTDRDADRDARGNASRGEDQPQCRGEGRDEGRSEGRIEVREIDAQALDFPDDSFDAVLMHLVVAIVPDPRACLAEAVRVVRPGGRLSILDKFAPEGRVPLWRRTLNPVAESVASSVNRQLGNLLGGLPVRIRDRHPVALGGFLEIVILTKDDVGDAAGDDAREGLCGSGCQPHHRETGGVVLRRHSGPTTVGRGEGLEEAERLLQKNLEWAERRLSDDPEAFRKLAQGQHPPFLFIGCCDSRKPLDTITVTRPGELFIHRNIANLVTPGDVASGAVLEFAVLALEVRHIIVCGHTRCGGMGAALRGVDGGQLGTWLAPVRHLVALHADELEAISSPSEREDRLSAINVVAQLENVLHHPCVARRLSGEGPPLHLHGWVFHVETGRLEALQLPERRWIEEGLIPPVTDRDGGVEAGEGGQGGAADEAGVPDGTTS